MPTASRPSVLGFRTPNPDFQIQGPPTSIFSYNSASRSIRPHISSAWAETTAGMSGASAGEAQVLRAEALDPVAQDCRLLELQVGGGGPHVSFECG